MRAEIPREIAGNKFELELFLILQEECPRGNLTSFCREKNVFCLVSSCRPMAANRQTAKANRFSFHPIFTLFHPQCNHPSPLNQHSYVLSLICLRRDVTHSSHAHVRHTVRRSDSNRTQGKKIIETDQNLLMHQFQFQLSFSNLP